MKDYIAHSGRTGHALPEAPPVPDYVDAVVLAADTAQALTVPAGATMVNFSGASGFFIDLSKTAVIPTGSISNGSSPIYFPGILSVKEGDVISLISSTANTVTVAYWA